MENLLHSLPQLERNIELRVASSTRYTNTSHLNSSSGLISTLKITMLILTIYIQLSGLRYNNVVFRHSVSDSRDSPHPHDSFNSDGRVDNS